jgi:hypothetical protein
VPLQVPPDQPTNVLPAKGAAVSVTEVPAGMAPVADVQVPVPPVVQYADVTEPLFRGLAIAVSVYGPPAGGGVPSPVVVTSPTQFTVRVPPTMVKSV